MSKTHIHSIFYMYDGEEFAHRIREFCARRRYNVLFNLYKLQNTNDKDTPMSGVSILLFTPDMFDFIRSGRHPDLNVLFPNPDCSIAILFHVDKTKGEIVSILSSRIRNVHKWTLLEFGTESNSLSPVVISIIDVIEKLEEKSDTIQQNFRVWTHDAVKPHQKLILIFAEAVDDDAQVRVIQKWNFLNVIAERLNSMTFSFSLGDAEPGENMIEVLVNDTVYGKAVLHVIPTEAKMEQLFKFLNNVINPIEVLCDCLNVVSDSREDLDQKLVHMLSNNTSSLSNIFEEFNWDKYMYKESSLELPTVLHFAAKYGFRFFCLELLKLPGGKQALRIKNKDGLLPYQIAKNERFDHLQLILQKYGREDLYELPKPVHENKAPVVKSKSIPAQEYLTVASDRSISGITHPSTIKQPPSLLSKTTVERPRFYSASDTKEETVASDRSISGTTHPSTIKQPPSLLSKTTVERPRFHSASDIKEESPWFDEPKEVTEQLRLNRKMTKVTAVRGDEEPQSSKRNNSVPDLPRFGRLMSKERPYEELD